MTKPVMMWVPCTPGGTPLGHLGSTSEDEAWRKLMRDARLYPTREGYIQRGYTVEAFHEAKRPAP